MPVHPLLSGMSWIITKCSNYCISLLPIPVQRIVVLVLHQLGHSRFTFTFSYSLIQSAWETHHPINMVMVMVMVTVMVTGHHAIPIIHAQVEIQT
jgi:hypothetical protein